MKPQLQVREISDKYRTVVGITTASIPHAVPELELMIGVTVCIVQCFVLAEKLSNYFHEKIMYKLM